jgi:rhizosphere induced protein
MADAGQVVDADLTNHNQITLNYNGGFQFINPTTDHQPGNLHIVEDGTIVLNKASVGIGLAGAATCLFPAQPNINAIFTPHPCYWIAFGNYQAGQVLDVSGICDRTEIFFPANVTSMTAILNVDGSWTIEQTTAVNAKFVEGRSKNSPAKWGIL